MCPTESPAPLPPKIKKTTVRFVGYMTDELFLMAFSYRNLNCTHSLLTGTIIEKTNSQIARIEVLERGP